MKKKAVVFDLDGTLLDTLADIAGALNHVLAEAGLPVHPLEAYRAFVGEGASELVRRALPEARRAALEQPILERYRARYREHLVVASRPYEGIEALLEALAARGIALAILTNKPHAPALTLVARLLGRHPWAAILGQREGVPLKPDPTSALQIAGALAVAPEACAFVGDSAIDVQTARRAGMTAIGCLWGFRGRAELEEAGAAHLVAHPAEVLALVDR